MIKIYTDDFFGALTGEGDEDQLAKIGVLIRDADVGAQMDALRLVEAVGCTYKQRLNDSIYELWFGLLARELATPKPSMMGSLLQTLSCL
jgi:hypothetical protein